MGQIPLSTERILVSHIISVAPLTMSSLTVV